MYSERHPAQSLSSGTGPRQLGVHLGLQALDEAVDGHTPLGRARPARVHARGSGLDVVVAHHEDVWELLQLGAADARAERLVSRLPPGAETVALQPAGHPP